MKSSDGRFKSSYSGPKRKDQRVKKKRRGHGLAVFAGCVAAVLFVAIGATALGEKSSRAPEQTQERSGSDATVTAGTLELEGVDISGLTREEAREKLLEQVSFQISVENGGDAYSLNDLAESWIDGCLEQVYADGADGTYELDDEVLREQLVETAAWLAGQWNVFPKDAMLDSYDRTGGRFVFREGCPGVTLNEEKLVSDVLAAVRDGQTNAVIQAEFASSEQELTLEQAQERYRTLATFTAETTDEAARNENIRLAAETLNGVIVRAGEEFSLNAVLGQRTEEKGYQQAADMAGADGETTVGGGVSQVASSLYQVAFRSGMEITFRRPYDSEPKDVTPGLEAAVDWAMPDFRFVNPSSWPVGIRASYSDRKITVALYGVPVLEDGVTWELESEKTESFDGPDPVYLADASLEPGEEQVQSEGTDGSRWVTYQVIYTNGVETGRVEDHVTTYQGRAAVILRGGTDADEMTADASTETASGTADTQETTRAAGTERTTEAATVTVSETTRAAETTKAAEETTKAAEETTRAAGPSVAETAKTVETPGAAETSATPKVSDAPTQTTPAETSATPQAAETPQVSDTPSAAESETAASSDDGVPIVPPLS
ncbi:MAG: VanW family protein [Clostridiales bacterium]|nr:VanW family protein [Clostridiales bacterium]